MADLLISIGANSGADTVDLASDAGYSVYDDGATLGQSVLDPVFVRNMQGEAVTVAQASRGDREAQLPVLVTGASLTEIEARVDALMRLSESVTRHGGTLQWRSQGGSTITRFKIAAMRVSPPRQFGDIDRAFRAVVTISLVIEPLGYGSGGSFLGDVATTGPQAVPVAAASVVGSADAQIGARITTSSSIASMLLSAWPKSTVSNNYCWNGFAELISPAGATVACGWVATAVSGVISAATSITRTTTAGKFVSGVAGFEIITPATTDTGASFAMYRRGGFKAGTTYTARCQVRAASGTTAVRIKLGKSGDLATGTASNLSATFADRYVEWAPASNTDVAYVAIGVSAATATTFQVDLVEVYEGTYAGGGAVGLIGPSAGYGPGVVPAAGYNPALSGSYWTAATDATYLVGTRVRGTGVMSTNAKLELPIRGVLFPPDSYTGESLEVDVDVFARVEIASTQTGLACAVSVGPLNGSSYGARRYARPFGSVGKALTLPSSGSAFRDVYLGTVTMRASNYGTEWLQLAFTNSGSASGTFGVDFVVLVPALRTLRTPSGKAADAATPFSSTSDSVARTVLHDGSVFIQDGSGVTPDAPLGGEQLGVPVGVNSELFVWPTTVLVDAPESNTNSSAMNTALTVNPYLTTRHHLLRQV